MDWRPISEMPKGVPYIQGFAGSYAYPPDESGAYQITKHEGRTYVTWYDAPSRLVTMFCEMESPNV